MNMIHHTEATIKSGTTRIYKDIFGQGPTNSAVHVWENILTIKLFGALTKLEESLITTVGGEKMVREIREHLANHGAGLFRQQLEAELNNQIDVINYWLNNDANMLYLFIVFKNRIDLIPAGSQIQPSA